MKYNLKIILPLLFSCMFATGYAQSIPIKPPKYAFSYDANGNMTACNYSFVITAADESEAEDKEDIQENRKVDMLVETYEGLLSIKNPSGHSEYKYRLYSVTGQLLQEGAISDALTKIDLLALQQSCYILTIYNETEKQSWKILRK